MLNDHLFTTTSILNDKPNTDNWKKGDFGPEWAKKTTEVMHNASFPGAMSLANQGPFKDVKRLLDVKGGSGCFAIAAANFNSDIECTILEWPQVCTKAKNTLKNLASKIELIFSARICLKKLGQQGMLEFFSQMFFTIGCNLSL